MRRIIIAAGICLLATVCSAQEKYSNSKWHFSFTVPEGWEVITDAAVLNNYPKIYEIRFKGSEILAVCQEAGSEAEGEKSSMLVQADAIGEAKEGLPMEVTYEERLRSNLQWGISNAYLKNFRDDLMKEGDVARDAEYERQIYYDPNRHIFFETIALPLKNGGAIGISTLKLLGSNKMTTLSFNLYGKRIKDLLGLVDGVADSFAYDEKHRFGEAPTTDIVKVLWHWLAPGAGIMIVIFIVYKWVASEYG
jgi:hypothetical protein